MSSLLAPIEDTAVAPIDWGASCATGQFVIDGRTFVTHAYPMTAKPMTWPTVGGIYSISGVYPGNDGRNLVGKTDGEKGFRYRWIKHHNDFRGEKHGNPYAQASYDRHPGEFVFWVMETDIEEADLGRREAFWYRYLQSDKDLHGWNIQVPTDEGTCQIAEETKEKLRQANLGKKHTEETKRKMSETRQRDGTWNRGMVGEASHSHGRTVSDETRRKLSEGVRGEKNGHWGKPPSQETRAKKCVSDPRRIGFRLQYATGEIFTYLSMGDFARREGVARGTITHFLSTAAIGETLMGWTKVEPYAGKNHQVARKSPPSVHVRDVDGTETTVTDIAGLAARLGIARANVRHFLVNAPIGTERFGLTKLGPYTLATYVPRSL